MSKKTPVFTPIDSGIKRDAPTPVKRKRNNNETGINQAGLNLSSRRFEDNQRLLNSDLQNFRRIARR